MVRLVAHVASLSGVTEYNEEKMKLIEALNLVFKYKTFHSDEEQPEETTVLEDVSLTINQGDFVGILGHNGSGKSTLAKQLTALLKPSGGAVYIKGMDSASPEHLISIRKTAGMVFQNPDNQLIGNIVEEDVAFGPENLGLAPEKIWQRVTEALEATGMTAYRMASPSALSGGQKQRIAISEILAMEPECIVLDEPTAMLDPAGREEVKKAIFRLNHEKNITIIYITHHMDEIKDADYLYVMNHGKIAMEGKPQEIWSRSEEFLSLGMRLPFLQELIYRLRQGGMMIPEHVSTEKELEQYLQNCLHIQK